jgi:hypothetical protein
LHGRQRRVAWRERHRPASRSVRPVTLVARRWERATLPALCVRCRPRRRSAPVLGYAVSIVGTLIGGALIGVVSAQVLAPLPVALLLMSSVKVWRHGQ